MFFFLNGSEFHHKLIGTINYPCAKPSPMWIVWHQQLIENSYERSVTSEPSVPPPHTHTNGLWINIWRIYLKFLIGSIKITLILSILEQNSLLLGVDGCPWWVRCYILAHYKIIGSGILKLYCFYQSKKILFLWEISRAFNFQPGGENLSTISRGERSNKTKNVTSTYNSNKNDLS